MFFYNLFFLFVKELIKSPDGTPLDLARALDFTLFVQLLGLLFFCFSKKIKNF